LVGGNRVTGVTRCMSSMSASVWMPVANYDLRRAGCVLFSFRFHLVRSRSSVGVRRVRALDAHWHDETFPENWKWLKAAARLQFSTSTSSPLASDDRVSRVWRDYDWSNRISESPWQWPWTIIMTVSALSLGSRISLDYRSTRWDADVVYEWGAVGRVLLSSGRFLGGNRDDIDPSCISTLYILRKQIKNSYLINLY